MPRWRVVAGAAVGWEQKSMRPANSVRFNARTGMLMATWACLRNLAFSDFAWGLADADVPAGATVVFV